MSAFNPFPSPDLSLHRDMLRDVLLITVGHWQVGPQSMRGAVERNQHAETVETARERFRIYNGSRGWTIVLRGLCFGYEQATGCRVGSIVGVPENRKVLRLYQLWPHRQARRTLL